MDALDTDDLIRRLTPIAEVWAKNGLYTALWRDTNGAHVVMSTSLPWIKRTIRTTAAPGDAIEIEIHGGVPIGEGHDAHANNLGQTLDQQAEPAPETVTSAPHTADAARVARSWRELGALVRRLGRVSQSAWARCARYLRTRSASSQ